MNEVVLEQSCQLYKSPEVEKVADKFLESFNKMAEQSKDPANIKEYHGIIRSR